MDFSALTDFLESLSEIGIPGSDCLIYHKNEQVYRKLTGFCDRENKRPMEADLLYNMYSATKPVTCVAALTLYEKGLYELRDPLYAYIPEFREMYIKTESGDVVKAESPITIRDLFTMCAGFDYNIRSKAVLETKKTTHNLCPTLEVIRALANEPLSFLPGTSWQYSLCHDVLGGLVEVLSGKTLGTYCRETIFEPLSMESTTYLPDASFESRMAPQYLYHRESKTSEKISTHNAFRLGREYESGGGGLVSSAEDMMQFAKMLTSGGQTTSGERVISRGTLNLLRTNQLDAGKLSAFHTRWRHMQEYGYGLGVRTLYGIEEESGEYGWSGAAGAYLLADPEGELSVFYAQHVLESPDEEIQPKLKSLIYEGIK